MAVDAEGPLGSPGVALGVAGAYILQRVPVRQSYCHPIAYSQDLLPAIAGQQLVEYFHD